MFRKLYMRIGARFMFFHVIVEFWKCLITVNMTKNINDKELETNVE